jgi:spore maturation protein CgeB
VDTTLHQSPWPLFVDALQEMSDEGICAFRFLNEAQFLLARTLKSRILTRLVDHITLKVKDVATRQRASQLVSRLFHYRRHGLQISAFNKALLAAAESFNPNVIIVVMGFYVTPLALKQLRRVSERVIVNYATDDPFNSRLSGHNVTESISCYDLYASTKKGIMDDVLRSGCPSVHYIPFAYNPSVHFPEPPLTPEEQRRFRSDVAFIGEADADRLPFIQRLAAAMPELNLALYGGMWERHQSTRRYARGIVRGRDFRMALGGTKIAINLVRRGNRDDHVMRTFEAPACGAFVLNEKTPEHLSLLRENREAAYFGSATELVENVGYYLSRDGERERIRAAGYQRIVSGRNTYKDRLSEILQHCKNLKQLRMTEGLSLESMKPMHVRQY